MIYLIGSDHAGVEVKDFIKTTFSDTSFKDVGCFGQDRVDYPDIAHIIGEAIRAGTYTRGILICGSGIGMSIAANRYKGVRAALCTDGYLAKMSRVHNDSNVLCLGARVSGLGEIEEMVSIWLNTVFEGGRHQDRIDKLI